MKTLLVIDANSLIHRAFHALPPLANSRGEMTNAVYGFVSILLRAIKELNPEYIAAAFDVAGPTERHKEFAEYKATRKKAPDELYNQFPFVKEFLEAFQIPIYEKEGFEADDIIGTIAKKAVKQKDVKIVIVSGDMDTLQLIEENIQVYTMRKGVQDTVLFDKDAVQKKFDGLQAHQVVDYKGLRGDPSDNIPGVIGVGEKTAIQILKEFNSIENLYKALDKGKTSLKPALKEKLESQKDNAVLSKKLATINVSVPISWDIQDASWKQYDEKKVRRLLERFEFGSLMKRLPGIKTQKTEELAGQGGLFREESFSKIERLYQDKVFSKKIYEVEKKLVPVLRNMEKAGIKIDKRYFDGLGKDMKEQIAVLKKKIHALAGKEFNVNSTQQTSEILFGDLQLPTRGLKKTPKGVISTASPELEKLKDEHGIVERILAYREVQKIYTTYVKPLPELADEKNRIHTYFDQFGAATGRISSLNPNLQNIPNQGEWGRMIRKGFVAEKGSKFVSFDYSQMELRIAAHITGDPTLISFFEKGADIHQMTAAVVFGVEADRVTPEMRYRAKALNFGILYGMGSQGFAKSAGISVHDARDFIENYFVQFPRIQEYAQEAKQQAREEGYVETLFGRRRYLPEIHSEMPQLRAAAERMAVNHPIQGTLADITKIAMVEIAEKIPKQNDEWNMLLQIHDELLFEVRDDIIEHIAGDISSIMEQSGALRVPVVVDMKQGDNWGEMEKLTI